LYTPRNRSATDQMNPEWFLIAPSLMPLLPRSERPDGWSGGQPIDGGLVRRLSRIPLSCVACSQHAEATRLVRGQETVVRTTRSVFPASEKVGEETPFPHTHGRSVGE